MGKLFCRNGCGQVGARPRRGLCLTCFTTPEVLERFPLAKRGIASKAHGTTCRHCKERKVNRPRGLCWRCFYTPGVPALYPSTSKYAKRGVGGGGSNSPLPAVATTAEPGSEAKIRVLMERAKRKEALFHPEDVGTAGGVVAWVIPAVSVHLDGPVITDAQHYAGDTFRSAGGDCLDWDKGTSMGHVSPKRRAG